eukprot:m.149219 g.149219  ORF g.149219 m.149219 type:complete len:82 (+) comp17340_c0_seq1:189-434(+)
MAAKRLHRPSTSTSILQPATCHLPTAPKSALVDCHLPPTCNPSLLTKPATCHLATMRHPLHFGRFGLTPTTAIATWQPGAP